MKRLTAQRPILYGGRMSVSYTHLWVILGAETGNRPDKVTPAREWVDNIVAFCEENEIPVFFKENLRKYFPDLPASAFPWEV